METKNEKPNNKIVTTDDAHNYLIQNIELKSFKKMDCFFAIYLDVDIEVLYIKTIEKKKTDSDLEIVGQILDFDKNLNVDSLIVCHKPLKNKGIEPESHFANMLIDKACFACINVLDYQWLFDTKYYHSMLHHKNVDFRKHSYQSKRIIKKNEKYTSNSNFQELFDMDIDKLKNIVELEYERIDSAYSFIFWELFNTDYYKYAELTPKLICAYKFELPLTKLYLVGIFKDYMKAKDQIIDFIIKSNRYDRYLLSILSYSEYKRMLEIEKVAIEEKSKIPTIKWNHTLEKSQIFESGQRVICNQFAVLDRPLPDGLKYWGIYLIDEVLKCECGNVLIALNGVYCPNVGGRICICGRDHFPPNAFDYSRFDLVHLKIV